jgi:hypothetical protein
MLVRLIYRAMDQMVGNENISQAIEARHKDQPEAAMAHLKNLGEKLKNVREQLMNQDSAKPLEFDKISENLNDVGDLPGQFSISFKLSERFDANTLVNELKAGYSGFSDSTLAWLKDCHQNTGRIFSHAECERVDEIRKEFEEKVKGSPRVTESHRRVLRELDDLKLRMEKTRIGQTLSDFKGRLKNMFSATESPQHKGHTDGFADCLIKVLAKPDVPIKENADPEKLGMALGYINSQWDTIKKDVKLRKPDFIAEFKAFLQRIDQACAVDKVLAQDLAKEFLTKHKLDRLIQNFEDLEKANNQ